MPEGPQVRRAGNLIETHVGAQITSITRPASYKQEWSLNLPVDIVSVVVVGKNLFIYLDGDKVIYNHMLMWGSWRAGCETVSGKRLHTCIMTTKGRLGYFGGGILKLITAEEAVSLQKRLGVDILQVDTAERAFAAVRNSQLPIGEALLEQTLIAGIGNIYKSEGLFAAKISPLAFADSIDAAHYGRLFAFLQSQMRADVRRSGPIATTTAELVRLGTRNFVYRRRHQPCVICRTLIERIYQGTTLKRSTYFCPHCQAAATI